MADNIWIIGATMTKFGRYPDKDSVDLASETALGALADAGATIQDMQSLSVGCLLEASNMLGQHLQKQIGQTGIPVFNVANACATGATAVRTAMLSI
jgi:acetyl-CoA acetyltransferase